MAKRHRDWPAGAPGSIDFDDEDEAAEYLRLVTEHEAAGNLGPMPWPASIPLEEVDGPDRTG